MVFMTKGTKTKATILQQAISMASVYGLEGLTIGRLATKTGMSKSGLFGHFGSKESLQFAILDSAIKDFSLQVVQPARKELTGQTQLTKLFSNWTQWISIDQRSGGCPLIAAAVELDHRLGKLHDYLVEYQIEWLDCVRRMAQKAVSEDGLKIGLDTRQFAFEFHGIGLSLNSSLQLLNDDEATQRAYTAFAKLIQNDHLSSAAKARRNN
jgi:AcrR family transcriptional regulator